MVNSYQVGLDQTAEGTPEGTCVTRTQAPRTRCFLAHACVVFSLSKEDPSRQNHDAEFDPQLKATSGNKSVRLEAPQVGIVFML